MQPNFEEYKKIGQILASHGRDFEGGPMGAINQVDDGEKTLFVLCAIYSEARASSTLLRQIVKQLKDIANRQPIVLHDSAESFAPNDI